MRRFIIRNTLFLCCTAIVVLAVLSRIGGTADGFYLRFTTPQQKDMILGSSRAAQGLQPRVLGPMLDNKIYNYSFTLGHSPWGPAYYESLFNKLDPDSRDGVFILEVNPWTLCAKTFDPNDSLKFLENDLCVGTTPLVNIKPNPFYIFRSFDGPVFKMFLDASDGKRFLHDDGWLEVNVPMDETRMTKRLKDRAGAYRRQMPNYWFSEVRFNSLKRTMARLSAHGQVFLVRMPIHPRIMKMENELMPYFNEMMNELGMLMTAT